MANQFKIDLHTHSTISPDGGLTASEYAQLISDPNVYIAVTDHNEIFQAEKLQQLLGKQIIVGEEILTAQGEIIGLYLSGRIQPGLSLQNTISEIKQQGGLVYIPHPLETGRQSLKKSEIEKHKKEIDIIEVFNARGLERGQSKSAFVLAAQLGIAMASASDAHGRKGAGSAWVTMAEAPYRENLVRQLHNGQLAARNAHPFAYIYPAWNRLKRVLKIKTHD